MDYKDLLALSGPHAPIVQIPIDTFTLRIQWIVAVLAGEFPAKEGALRRAAGALTVSDVSLKVAWSTDNAFD